MDTIELQIDNAPNIRFSGTMLARVSSQSAASQRWTVLEVYRTQGGKLIGYKEGHSMHDGEYKKCSGAVADTPEQLIAFFGHTQLAKSLYRAAEIEDVILVD